MAIENHELVDIIRKRKGDVSLTEFAASIKVPRSYLSEVLGGNRAVSSKLAEAMGYVRVKTSHIVFRKKNGRITV